jgi:hypothetical protein
VLKKKRKKYRANISEDKAQLEEKKVYRKFVAEVKINTITILGK